MIALATVSAMMELATATVAMRVPIALPDALVLVVRSALVMESARTAPASALQDGQATIAILALASTIVPTTDIVIMEPVSATQDTVAKTALCPRPLCLVSVQFAACVAA